MRFNKALKSLNLLQGLDTCSEKAIQEPGHYVFQGSKNTDIEWLHEM
jgi:hypothetical protein